MSFLSLSLFFFEGSNLFLPSFIFWSTFLLKLFLSSLFFILFLLARSPAFTHLAATLSGLSTVRAFSAEHLLQSEFDCHQDTHTACCYMFAATGSAFGLSLDIMCWIFMGCILCFYLLVDTGATGEMVGLALTQVLSLTGSLQWGEYIYRNKIEIIFFNVKRLFVRCSTKCGN